MMDNWKNIRSNVKIMAPVNRVWEVLLDPLNTQQWASVFSEGAWVEAEWRKGGLVIWKDKAGEIGSKGVVTAIERNQLLEVSYFDQVDMHPPTPTGKYKESFTISSLADKTLLAIEAGPLSEKTAEEQERLWEKGLNRIKALAEAEER